MFQGLSLVIMILDNQFDIQQHSRSANIILEHSSWTTSDLRPMQVLREMEYHLRSDAHGCHVCNNHFFLFRSRNFCFYLFQCEVVHALSPRRWVLKFSTRTPGSMWQALVFKAKDGKPFHGWTASFHLSAVNAELGKSSFSF